MENTQISSLRSVGWRQTITKQWREGKMTEDEKYVREHWEDPWLADSWDKQHWGVVLITAALAVWSKQQNSVAEFKTPEQAWSAAAEFTRDLKQQIRDVEEEIRVANGCISAWSGSNDYGGLAPMKRILAREQAALADLKRGLREQK
jgi:hypothetical protein